jgi:hypothetical protein
MIDRAMSMSSDERFATVAQFWEALQQACNVSIVHQYRTKSAAAPDKEETGSGSSALPQQALEPSTGITDALALDYDKSIRLPQAPTTLLSDVSHEPIVPATVKSLVTKPLGEPPPLQHFRRYGAVVLTVLALLITLLASLLVGASLWYYIHT